ncbi:MAG: transcriptional repressor [Clostridia bacterium]|nr:transcriptional repressor [Clostridia bacterium]
MAKYSTRQRKALALFLSEHPDESFSAVQIASALEPERISLSAVYRNLGELVSQGVICRTQQDNSREILYRYTQAESCRMHLHLACSRCGKTFHMDVPGTDRLIEQVAENADFRVDRSSTVLHGVCGNCMQSAGDSS